MCSSHNFGGHCGGNQVKTKDQVRSKIEEEKKGC